MKKIFLIYVLIVQLLLVFFYIYTQSRIIQLTYSYQDTEHIVSDLQKRQKQLTHDLLEAQESQNLKNYATNQLHMKKMRITDIKELPQLHD